MKKYKNDYPILFVLLIVGLVSCSKDAPQSVVVDNTSAEQRSIWLDTKPGQFDVVSAVRGSAVGTEVVVEGVIAGVVDPFSESYAAFVIADDALVYCNEMGDDDHCATPWDACCEDVEKRKRSLASVQIVDAEGFPLEQSAKAGFGLKEMDRVIVKGFVAESSTPENLIITAKGIYRDE